MTTAGETCWTMIHGAARGDALARAEFARGYSPVVRAYLRARWRTHPLCDEVDDYVQEVFIECFKQNGVLTQADSDRPGGFRAYLFGVIRNIAVDAETKRGRLSKQQTGEDTALADASNHEEQLSVVFDRAWATALMREAAERQAEVARAGPDEARKRVELLHMRFYDDLPIREIARRWQVDAAWLHHEYARARQEFKEALHEVILFHHPAGMAQTEAEAECARMMGALG